MNTRLRKILLAALFCAIAIVGSIIKPFQAIPLLSSIAFDSFPAFLAALLMGGPYGAIVGALGHMMSAALGGFPLTVPMHLVIAAEMAAICYLTGWMAKKGGKMVMLSAVVAFLLNAFLSPAILIIWPGMGLAVYLSFLLPLALASFANVALAALLYYPLKKPYELIIQNKK